MEIVIEVIALSGIRVNPTVREEEFDVLNDSRSGEFLTWMWEEWRAF
jgi:hypothetical protein